MFKVGDIVMTYTEDAPYYLTKGDWVGQVVATSGARMTVETLIPRRGKEIEDPLGHRYNVAQRYFCLAK